MADVGKSCSESTGTSLSYISYSTRREARWLAIVVVFSKPLFSMRGQRSESVRHTPDVQSVQTPLLVCDHSLIGYEDLLFTTCDIASTDHQCSAHDLVEAFAFCSYMLLPLIIVASAQYMI